MSSDGVNIDKFLLYVYKIQYNCMSKSYEYSFKKNSVTLIFFLFHHNCLLLIQFYNKTKKQKPSQNICRVTFFHKWIGLREGSNVKQVNYYVHVFLVTGCRCPAVESNRRRGLWSSPVFCLFKRNSKKACIKVSAHWNLTYLHRGRKKNVIFLSREYLIFMWHCITEIIYDENCALALSHYSYFHLVLSLTFRIFFNTWYVSIHSVKYLK